VTAVTFPLFPKGDPSLKLHTVLGLSRAGRVHLNAIKMSNVAGLRVLLGRYRVGFPPCDVALRFQLQHSLVEFVVVPLSDEKRIHTHYRRVSTLRVAPCPFSDGCHTGGRSHGSNKDCDRRHCYWSSERRYSSHSVEVLWRTIEQFNFCAVNSLF